MAMDRSRNKKEGFAPAHDVVYADNNASTPVFPQAIQAMTQAYASCYANPSSIHAAGKHARRKIEDQRLALAALVGANPSEITFTSGATESNNMAIRGVMASRLFARPDASAVSSTAPAAQSRYRIVTTPVEHASVYETAASVAGAEVVQVRVDAYGRIDEAHFDELLADGSVGLVAIIMGNNEIGTLQDVHALGLKCRAASVHLHCDMTQVFGKYRIDLRALGVDSATMSAHKFHGPKGVGALYVRSGADVDNVCITGGTQEKSRRGGTENVGGICGMVVALQRCMVLLALNKEAEVRAMRDWTAKTLRAALPELVVNGHPRHALYNTLSVCLPSVNSRQLIPELDAMQVYVNVGCACSRGEGSATLKALGLDERHVNGSLRISYGFMNSMDDCKKLCAAMIHAVHEVSNRTATSNMTATAKK